MNTIKNTKIGVIGTGYVGLPLAVAFGKKFPTIGFDINQKRIEQLRKGIDLTKEASKERILSAKNLRFSFDPESLRLCNFFIVSVPTPIDNFKVPDFSPLVSASTMLGRVLKKGDVVVYESTVYPGATEEICVPVLEKESGLIYNKDFFAGYSPERINPADKEHQIESIVKVTSGSTPEAGKYIDGVYKEIITAGTFLVDNMKTAEACKVIENAQRDLNIAFMNEISILMEKLGIDTQDVLAATRTKWNALPFFPGLVGGHCIGVDPYYLIHKAYSLGFDMKIARSARIVNDRVTAHIANLTVTKMCQKKINPGNSRALILGVTFKENCPDIRNARPIDIATELEKFGVKVDFFDPVADSQEVVAEYQVKLQEKLKENSYDAIVLAVAHDQFKKWGVKKIKKWGKKDSVLFDVKAIFGKNNSDLRL